jgi:hypothetical protein
MRKVKDWPDVFPLILSTTIESLRHTKAVKTHYAERSPSSLAIADITHNVPHHLHAEDRMCRQEHICNNLGYIKREGLLTFL